MALITQSSAQHNPIYMIFVCIKSTPPLVYSLLYIIKKTADINSLLTCMYTFLKLQPQIAQLSMTLLKFTFHMNGMVKLYQKYAYSW